MTAKTRWKRKYPFHLSQARAFWRVAKKKRNAGDQKSADWYEYQAQMAYTRYRDAIAKTEGKP